MASYRDSGPAGQVRWYRYKKGEMWAQLVFLSLACIPAIIQAVRSDDVLLRIIVAAMIITGLFWTIRRYSRPVMGVSDEHLIIGEKEIPWRDIKWIRRIEDNGLAPLEARYKVFVNEDSMSYSADGHTVGLSMIGDGEDLYTRIKERFPGMDSWELSGAGLVWQSLEIEKLGTRRPCTPVNLGKTRLTTEGIVTDKGVIPWELVLIVKYVPGLISSGRFTVFYGDEDSAKVIWFDYKGANTGIEAAGMIMHHATKARVSPNIVRLARSTPADRSAMIVSAVIIVAGMLLGMTLTILIDMFELKETWSQGMELMMVTTFMSMVAAAIIYMHQTNKNVPGWAMIAAALVVPLSAIGMMWMYLDEMPEAGYAIRAGIYEKRGDMDKAERMYMDALRVSGNSTGTNYAAGMFYLKRGMHAEALPYLVTAYRGAPNFWYSDLAENVAMIMAKTGRSEEAIRWCERVSAEHKDNESYVRKMREAKELIERGVYDWLPK